MDELKDTQGREGRIGHKKSLQISSHKSSKSHCLPPDWEIAFGYPRNFLNNKYIYLVISPRACGLSIGVDLTPDRSCNFNCVYCEINRAAPLRVTSLCIPKMIEELSMTLRLAYSEGLRKVPGFENVADELLVPRHVAISGDGEPTLSSQFAEAMQAIVHLRALSQLPYFKIVVLTNGTRLKIPYVMAGLSMLNLDDEIWVKLDAGSEEYFNKINRPVGISFQALLENIISFSQKRPIVLQSLFPRINGKEPTEEEIEAYIQTLRKLKAYGAQIKLVQVYSAIRPAVNPAVEHLPLRSLSKIAAAVRDQAGLPAEVY